MQLAIVTGSEVRKGLQTAWICCSSLSSVYRKCFARIDRYAIFPLASQSLGLRVTSGGLNLNWLSRNGRCW
jgi:hypothetical protein